jgi:hypothetical protein
VKKVQEKLSTVPSETEENADRLAEQMAKATLNTDEKKE